MAIITLILQDGISETLNTETGITIMDALADNDKRVPAPCGGRGVCGKCRVKVEGNVSEPDAREQEVLADSLKDGIRLACRTIVQGDVTVTMMDYEKAASIQSDGIMPEFTPDPMFSQYGLAVDIGTTTVVARLYGMNGMLASASLMNPQRQYGADVITRIEKSLAGEGDELAGAIRNGIEDLIDKVANDAGIKPADIDAAVITGNTTMLYLLMERDVDCLSHAPFIADELFGKFYTGKEVGLSSIPECKVYLPKCMAAFVGADITTAFLASGIYGTDKVAMMADIGTNGEICLWKDGKLVATSTAAGPVFEGATLSQGMQGSVGAIEHVSVDGDSFKVKVIGDVEATGICGSGIIDAVACFLDTEVVEESGIFADDDDEIYLTDEVAVTQKDIRMVQLAKGAVCAGMMTLIDVAGLEADDLDELAIAGGFGSHLDIHSAAVIGLYPEELEDKVSIIGNAALSGAAMILLNSGFIAETEEFVGIAEVVELSSNPTFTNYYMDCMQFGEL